MQGSSSSELDDYCKLRNVKFCKWNTRKLNLKYGLTYNVRNTFSTFSLVNDEVLLKSEFLRNIPTPERNSIFVKLAWPVKLKRTSTLKN